MPGTHPFSDEVGGVDGHESLAFQQWDQGGNASVGIGVNAILERQAILGAHLFDLQLLAAKSSSELPSEGKRLIIVGGNASQVFLRIFDRRGVMVVDLDHSALTEERFRAVKAVLLKRKHVVIKSRLRIIKVILKTFNVHRHDPYGWHINTHACFNAGGSAWRRWNAMMLPQLVETQHDDGSWPADFAHIVNPELVDDVPEKFRFQLYSEAEASVVVTALYALTLEVNYRYLLNE